MSMDINISYPEFVASDAFPKLCCRAAKAINNIFLVLTPSCIDINKERDASAA